MPCIFLLPVQPFHFFFHFLFSNRFYFKLEHSFQCICLCLTLASSHPQKWLMLVDWDARHGSRVGVLGGTSFLPSPPWAGCRGQDRGPKAGHLFPKPLVWSLERWRGAECAYVCVCVCEGVRIWWDLLMFVARDTLLWSPHFIAPSAKPLT